MGSIIEFIFWGFVILFGMGILAGIIEWFSALGRSEQSFESWQEEYRREKLKEIEAKYAKQKEEMGWK